MSRHKRNGTENRVKTAVNQTTSTNPMVELERLRQPTRNRDFSGETDRDILELEKRTDRPQKRLVNLTSAIV